eukprot:TRINITY_DN9943_c0_g1_i14.p1 TRINITY_DN9943_c0_g1~~TRINITY_DN9943_c0_g1_i14.p1  ORF type:complete len:395 (-),score=25.46 TRINITY_DN9943_c0_g1_i14:196-1380(-)
MTAQQDPALMYGKYLSQYQELLSVLHPMYSAVSTQSTWGVTHLVTPNTTTNISHTSGLGPVRQSFGKWYIENSENGKFRIFKLEYDPATKLADFSELQFTLNKTSLPHQGHDLYFWWPGPNYLVARLYDGKTLEFYGFHENIEDAILHPEKYPKDQLIDGPYFPETQIMGNIIDEPRFRNGKMYMARAIPENNETVTYILSIYEKNSIWGIKESSRVVTNNSILSLASFPDAVLAIYEKSANQYFIFNMDTNTTATVSFIGGWSGCDSVLKWTFLQTRMYPENLIHSQVYFFCKKYEMYPVSFNSGTNTLAINVTAKITLPDDLQESNHKTGRYNLYYPHDLAYDVLINFAPHPCSNYVKYKWDEYNDMSVNFYNISSKTTICKDLVHDDEKFP